MYKILVPIDGSKNALRAVAHAAALVRGHPKGIIHLVNVQPALPGAVTTFVGKGMVDRFHREEAAKALAAAQRLLDKAGVAYKAHVGIGAPGAAIATFVEKLDCDQVVMGTRGLGAALGLVLGSVANAVVYRVRVPVTLVK